MRKKILSLITTLVMVVGLISMMYINVSASDEYSYKDYKYRILNDGSIGITDYSGNDEFISIPESIDGKQVKYISDKAFESSHSLNNVKLPDTIHNIKPNAFSKCENLKSINIPDNVVYIRESAFEGCSSLTDIAIGKGVKIIEEKAFKDCSSLLNVSISDNVTTIEPNVFDGTAVYENQTDSIRYVDNWLIKCTYGTNVNIPEGTVGIADRAFSDLADLASVVLPKSIRSIGSYSFEYCYNLSSVNIPKNVTRVGCSAFFGTKIISEQKSEVKYIDDWVVDHKSGNNASSIIEIPQGCKKIAELSFCWCKASEVIIPDSVEYIGARAFNHMDNLSSMVIPGNISVIDEYAFSWNENLTKVIIEKGTTQICRHAFDDCPKLKSITVPSTVTVIEDWAFGYNDDAKLDLTVFCIQGSVAESYSKENQLNYQLITEPSTTANSQQIENSESNISKETTPTIYFDKGKKEKKLSPIPYIATSIGGVIAVVIVIIGIKKFKN